MIRMKLSVVRKERIDGNHESSIIYIKKALPTIT